MTRFEQEVISQGLVAQWEVWQRDFGFRVLPKRDLVIPQPDQMLIREMFLQDDLVRFTLNNLTGFQGFLEKVPIADQFGGDHTARRRWKQRLSEEYLPLFQLEQRSNQFRGAAMGSVFAARYSLENRMRNAGHQQRAERLAVISEEWEVLDRGYDRLSYDNKLQCMQLMENRCIEILGYFSSSSAQQVL